MLYAEFDHQNYYNLSFEERAHWSGIEKAKDGHEKNTTRGEKTMVS